MSLNTTVYNALKNDKKLSGMLAKHKLTITAPAIYEQWAAEDTDKPYINLTYTFTEGNHWARRDCSIFVDIFTSGDTITAEAIRNRVIEILDRSNLMDIEDGEIRVYLDNDNIIDEDRPEICHWNIEFTCILWRNDFIDFYNNEQQGYE